MLPTTPLADAGKLATEPATVNSATVAAEARRIASIDIFRGFNVLLMVFVDNLGFVKGLPWWTYHMPADANGMTYVDMVFPAFLFLMGMSIPISIQSRITKGQARRRIWAHVVLRSLSLVVMGLFIANAPQVDVRSTGISSTLWTVLGFVSIGLCLVRFPGSDGSRVASVLRIMGLLLLVCLAAIFRRATAQGQIAWLDFSDWEILGLLGWAYLSVSAIYLLCGDKLVFKRRIPVLIFALAAFVTINALSTAGRLNSLPPYLKPFEAGLSSITMAGLLASLVITDDTIAPSLQQKLRWGLCGATILFAAGWLLRPLGISKIHDTPAWCLYCMSANVLLAMLLYWLADLKGGLRWTRFAGIIGGSALLAYFLPYVAYLIPQLSRITADGTSGWFGVVKSAFFTGIIFTAVTFLYRFKINLRI